MLNLTKTYIADKRGNFATTFAIMLAPLLIGIGAAVDLSRLTQAHNELQNAADSAALSAAVAVQQGSEQKNMKQQGKETFNTNLNGNESLNVTNLKVQKNRNNTVNVEATAKLQPMFMQVFGYPKLDVSVQAQATTGSSMGAEVVFAVDTTNSMKYDTRWDTAMTSVESILNQMKASAGASEFYTALVPFTDRVNIGNSRKKWISGPIPNNWQGCVEPREEVKGDYSWMLDDDRATTQPFAASIPNSKLPIGGSNNYTINCAQTEIVEPTSNPKKIIKELKSLKAGGTGRLDVGLAWGWRLLSSKWAGDWGKQGYPTTDLKKRQKFLIYMTDGNTMIGQGELSQEMDWGWNDGSKVLFEHIEEQCRNIKEDGIQLFMLQVAGNDHATPYFERCATSPEYFYRINTPEDISNAFEDVLSRFASDVRLLN